MDQNSFTKIATRILKTQKKLGALKGLTVKPLTISDSRKNRLKKMGLYATATLGSAALLAGGIYGGKKVAKTETYKNIKGKLPNVKGKLPNVKEKLPKFPKVKGRIQKVKENLPHPSKKVKIAAAAGSAVALAAGAGASVALSKKQTILIEAKYTYGTKLFEVARLREEEIHAGVDKQILREVTATVSQLKNAQDWAVKESASFEFLEMAEAAESLVEEVMYAEMVEEALEEGYIYEDEDLEEGYIFEDEDLEEGYIFEDEDLEEGYLFEDDEDDEDDEDLAEAYIFED